MWPSPLFSLKFQLRRRHTDTFWQLFLEGSVCFENCETEFRSASCIRQGGVEAQFCWDLAKDVLWKAECLTAIFAESERVQNAHEDKCTMTRAPHRGCFSLPKYRGKQLMHLTHHHGNTQGPMKPLHLGDLWELSHPRKLALATLSNRSNLERFPKDSPVRTLMKSSCLALKKMSRPYGMIFQHG